MMKSLKRALAVLETFTKVEHELGVTEISRLTSLPKSTVMRILKTLEEFHYVSQYNTKYRLGSAAIRLGQKALRSIQLRAVAITTMKKMAQECKETILLITLNEERNRAICIERIESNYGIRLSVEVGKQMYLHAGASAKALLAYMSDKEINHIIATVGLPQVSTHTITDAKKLWKEIRQVREKGYAESVEETDEGAAGVGVPILTETGELIGAIAIAGPIDRMMRKREENIQLAQRGALQIAVDLGLIKVNDQ
jgi:DNA-binding IclR family transcriptional regulator